MNVNDDDVKLVPGPLPQGRYRGWPKVVKDFWESGEGSALVVTERSLQARYMGCYQSIRRLGMQEDIGVSRKGDEVWLYRKDTYPVKLPYPREE